LVAGHLHLEDEFTFVAEGKFGADQVKLPHPAESFIVKVGDLVPIFGEPRPPGF
jgi:hypothetical protein